MFVRPEDVFFKDRGLFIPVGVLILLFLLTAALMIGGGLDPFFFSVFALIYDPLAGRNPPHLKEHWKFWKKVGPFVLPLLVLGLIVMVAAGWIPEDVREHGFVPWRIGLWAVDWVAATWFCAWVWKVRQAMRSSPDQVPTYRERSG